MEFHIDKMHCGGCARGVTAAIRSVDPNAKVDVVLDTRTVEVESAEPREAFLPVLEQAGFPVAAA